MLLRLCTLLSFCTYLAAQQSAMQPPDWKAVLNWLPADTQTLIVASQPFTIPQLHDDDNESSPMESLRALSLGRSAEFPLLYEALAGRTVSFSVAGVRRFLGFSGLGLGPYEGCAVIAFSQPLATTLEAILTGARKEYESDAAVFILSTVREGSMRTRPEQLHLFVTQLNPRTLAVATDRGSLQSLLGHRKRPVIPRALPPGLSEWKQVDPAAPVWALRHYRRSSSSTQKVSALSLGPLEEIDDSDAIGLVYNGKLPGPAQTIDYFSNNPKAIEIARRHWEWKAEGLASPNVSRLSAGVVRVVVPTPSSDATASFTILLLASLGFVIAM